MKDLLCALTTKVITQGLGGLADRFECLLSWIRWPLKPLPAFSWVEPLLELFHRSSGGWQEKWQLVYSWVPPWRAGDSDVDSEKANARVIYCHSFTFLTLLLPFIIAATGREWLVGWRVPAVLEWLQIRLLKLPVFWSWSLPFNLHEKVMVVRVTVQAGYGLKKQNATNGFGSTLKWWSGLKGGRAIWFCWKR